MDYYIVPQLVASVDAAQNVDAVGRYIRYLLDVGNVSAPMIEVKTNTGKRLLLEPGDDAIVTGPEVTQWRVRNYNGTSAIDAVLEIGGIEEKITSNRIKGDVNLASSASRLLGIVYGNLGQLDQRAVGGRNALVATKHPYTYGASVISTTDYAGTAITLVAAASNTNGMIVWRAKTASRTNTAATCPTCAITAHTAAPTITQGDHLASSNHGGSNDAGGSTHAEVLEPVYVASGKGLYAAYSGNVNGPSLHSALYSLL